MKICKAIHSTFCEFANVTTIHGLAYVFDKTIKAIDYVFWFIAVCLGTGLAIYSSFDAWKEWKASPVLTSIRSTGLPLQNISFPAITICSQGLIKAKICIKYRKHWKSYVSFQLSGQIGLIWAVLKLFSKLTAISPAKDIFLYQFATRYRN